MDLNLSIDLKFSQEELLFLINFMRVGTLPGMGEDPLNLYSEVERPMILRAGFNSLQARGLLEYDVESQKVSLDTLPLAIISTCSNPQVTFYVGRVPVDTVPTITYYHRREKLVVSHRMAANQIHGMTAFFDSSAVTQAIQGDIHRNEWKDYPFPKIEIESELFDKLLKSLSEVNIHTAKGICSLVGLAEVESDSIIRCLQSMQANTTIAVTRFDQQHNVSQGEIYAWVEFTDGIVRVESIDREGQEIVRLSAMPAGWEIPVHALYSNPDE